MHALDGDEALAVRVGQAQARPRPHAALAISPSTVRSASGRPETFRGLSQISGGDRPSTRSAPLAHAVLAHQLLHHLPGNLGEAASAVTLPPERPSTNSSKDPLESVARLPARDARERRRRRAQLWAWTRLRHPARHVDRVVVQQPTGKCDNQALHRVAEELAHVARPAVVHLGNITRRAPDVARARGRRSRARKCSAKERRSSMRSCSGAGDEWSRRRRGSPAETALLDLRSASFDWWPR